MNICSIDMNKFLTVILLTLSPTLALNPQERTQKTVVLLSVGTNLSSYLNEDGAWQLGYDLGLTFNIHVYRNLSMTLPFSYTRIEATPKNVEGKFYSHDGYIYKMFFNSEISIGFLEFPFLLDYKFYSTESYDLSYMLGPALALGVKDLSKPARGDDVTITNEIIGTYNVDSGDVYESDAYRYLKNSGINLNTGIRFHVSRFYIDLLYCLYPYKIKHINKLNTISLRLGIDLE